MKTILLSLTLFMTANCWAQPESQGKFNDGYSRISYINVKGCKVEFQSFDSTLTENDLALAMSFFYRIGSKNRGVENEFKTYRSFDFSGKSKTKVEIISYSQNQLKAFRTSVKKMTKQKVPKQFVALKEELFKVQSNNLRLEEIFNNWYKTGNDIEFRAKILSFYSDVYVVATLDKTLAITNYYDKLKYSHAELFDLFNAKVFPIDKFIEMQNELFHKHNIEVVIDENCTK